MTRNEQLVFCKKCTNRKMDLKEGIICNLTGRQADFKENCPDYNLDTTIVESKDIPLDMVDDSVRIEIPSEKLEKLRSEQNFKLGLAVSIIVGLIGAILWAAITISTNFQIGYMALVIGAGVGYSMRIFGKGVDQIFGITGAVIALVSCALGNFFSLIGYVSEYENLGYFDTLAMFDYSQLIPVMSETFSAIDILFYGIAAFEGYKFAFRTFTEEDLVKEE